MSLREYLSRLTPGDPPGSLESDKDSGVYVRVVVRRSLVLDRPKGMAMELIESKERQQTCSAPSITSSGLHHGVSSLLTEVVLMPLILFFFSVFPSGTTQSCGCKWERNSHPHSPGGKGTCDLRAGRGKRQEGA